MTWKCIVLLLLPVMASAEFLPTGIQSWADADQRRIQLGGPPRHYPVGDEWSLIENNWVTIDTLHTNRRGLIKADVNNAGQIFMSVAVGDGIATVAQRLLSLKWFRESDSTWFNIDSTPEWSIPLVANNSISWTNVFPDVDVTIAKHNGQLDYELHFKKPFLDQAVTAFNQRADSADIYLANVIAIQLMGISNADSSLGTKRERRLKSFGRHLLKFRRTYLQYPMDSLDPLIRIHQRHIIKDDKLYMLEMVKMSDLKLIHEKYPTQTLWHNATTTFNDTTAQNDAALHGGAGDAVDHIGAFHDLVASVPRTMVIDIEGIASTIGAVGSFTDVTIDFAIVAGAAFDSLYFHFMWKILNMDSVSYNDFDAPDFEWGTAGVGTTNDAGTKNSTDGGGDDRKATEAAVIDITSATSYQVSLGATNAELWYDDLVTGLFISNIGSSNFRFGTTDNTTAGNRWFSTWTYTVAGGDEAPRRRRRRIKGFGI